MSNTSKFNLDCQCTCKPNAQHYRPINFTRTSMAFFLFTALFLLSACNPTPIDHQVNGSLAIESTISADGEMIAVLDRPPPRGIPRLRTKRLLPHETEWKNIAISSYITNIRFGLNGKNLLLTEVLGDSQQAILASWDLEKPEKNPTLLHEGYRLAFPIEFKPDHYLVRSCNNERSDWPCTDSTFNSQWEWVHNRKSLKVFDRKTFPNPLLFSQPTIARDDGFFWFDSHKTPHFIAMGFNGETMDSPKLPLDESTTNIKCDQQVQRCLQLFQKSTAPNGNIIYAFTIHENGMTCKLQNVEGFSDGYSLSPDGKSAVISIAERADMHRDVVVLRFKKGACPPTSIQKYSFEASKS